MIAHRPQGQSVLDCAPQIGPKPPLCSWFFCFLRWDIKIYLSRSAKLTRSGPCASGNGKIGFDFSGSWPCYRLPTSGGSISKKPSPPIAGRSHDACSRRPAARAHEDSGSTVDRAWLPGPRDGWLRPAAAVMSPGDQLPSGLLILGTAGTHSELEPPVAPRGGSMGSRRAGGGPSRPAPHPWPLPTSRGKTLLPASGHRKRLRIFPTAPGRGVQSSICHCVTGLLQGA